MAARTCSWSSTPEDGKEIIVDNAPVTSPDSPSRNYTLLEDAVAIAQHGDTIRIRPGTYAVAGRIQIMHDIMIVGEAHVKIVSSDACVFECVAESACLSRLEIESAPLYYAWRAAAIEVRSGFCEIDQCSVTAKGCTGIKVSATAECLLDRTAVLSCALRGLSVCDTATVQASKCRFENNKLSGVAVYNEGHASFTQCKFMSNGMSGCVASDLADVALEGCEVLVNDTLNVDSGDVTIRHCSVRATIEGCRISASGVQLNDLMDERSFRSNTFHASASRRCSVQ